MLAMPFGYVTGRRGPAAVNRLPSFLSSPRPAFNALAHGAPSGHVAHGPLKSERSAPLTPPPAYAGGSGLLFPIPPPAYAGGSCSRFGCDPGSSAERRASARASGVSPRWKQRQRDLISEIAAPLTPPPAYAGGSWFRRQVFEGVITSLGIRPRFPRRSTGRAMRAKPQTLLH